MPPIWCGDILGMCKWTGTTNQCNSTTVSLPEAGASDCVSVAVRFKKLISACSLLKTTLLALTGWIRSSQGLRNPNEPFHSAEWDASQLPKGTLLLLFAQLEPLLRSMIATASASIMPACVFLSHLKEAGMILLFLMQDNCMEALNIAAFCPRPDGYTIVPGIVGHSLDVFRTFQILLFIVPAHGGIVQVL